ncbi:MAG TPA: hypothetical protein VIF84_00680 [Candidatus Limnocylindrales bacterium]
MSPVEILFLVLGLCIGIAVGAALLDLTRARPAPREVRLTITRNALPVRDATVVTSTDLVARPTPSPAPVMAAAVIDDPRVPFEVARGVDPSYAAIRRTHEPVLAGVTAMAAADTPTSGTAGGAEGRIGVAMGDDSGPEAGEATAPDGQAAATAGGAPTAGGAAAAASESDPCGQPRRLTDERCAVAASAREQAEAAAASLRLARRSYDEVVHRIEEAQARVDPRAVTEAKEAARHTFRDARDHALSRSDLEHAASTWLNEINRVNLEVRDATMLIAREQGDAATLLASIERQALAADAARITAEAAGEACQEARAALAACESGELAATSTAAPAMSPAMPTATALLWDRDAGHQPEIVRLLRGEAEVRERLLSALAGADQDEQRRYQLWLSELVDAIFAASIEAAVLDFPIEHPFWSTFDRTQSRDIVIALASLGYRFDGFGGFAADRLPGQRELSLAVGYAALDPMRIRHWPTATEMAELMRGVTVAADEFLASRAPDLELGEMIAVLGRRSEALSDLWNRWGRVRPLLVVVAQ